MEKGETNAIYNVHGNCELRNIEVLKKLASALDVPENEAFLSIPNRVGQDVRYSLDDSKVRALGWMPRRNFDEELKKIAFEDDFKRFL
jgi:dTDP-glucose 4,6-dehydratase